MAKKQKVIQKKKKKKKKKKKNRQDIQAKTINDTVTELVNHRRSNALERLVKVEELKSILPGHNARP